ncbi:MAG TPA: condensation domain-containing protein, partial [Thermoanaerobaculia bacterium]|nr:condensation domain-containing protein [Thermoanaerobaculia bacterium]
EPLPRVSPENLAYLIYTSGSTGRPKAVAIRHQSAAALLRWAEAAFSDEEMAGVLASTSICFDMSVFELFAPLARGGAMVMAENALALPTLAERGRVTLVDTVPSAMAHLVQTGGVPDSVRTVNLGGEPLSGSLVRGIHELDFVRRVLNLYGPSEDTTFSTVHEAPRGSRHEPTIGRTLPGSQGYVLDAAGQIAPVGVRGELFLGGVGLSRGYLGRPGLTAEKFLPDPFGAPGARFYRTGDLARRLPDGELQYLGRIDHQVKIRGFRVELGEIEAALRACPGVNEAVVLARHDGGEPRLVAYLVPSGPAPEAADLREHLRRSLPEYMVPSAFVALAAFPLSPNGKVDRKALPDSERQEEESQDPAGFATPAEEIVASIWAETLELDHVSRNDDFFELGGHSLLAARALARVREALGADLPLRALFEASTPAALARAAEAAVHGVALPPLHPIPRDGEPPLSFAQERLWFLEQLAPGGSAYNIPVAVRLRGRLRADLLGRSLSEIARRHEVLRSSFPAVGGRPALRIASALPLDPARVDLTGLPAGLREEEAAGLASAEAVRPFDLERGPLARTALLRLSEDEHVLLLNLHHAVADGGSVEILLRELGALYREEPLPEPPVQYADFAAWQRSWLSGENLENQIAWWREHLDGAPAVLDLPADRPRPAAPSQEGGWHPVRLPAGLTRELADLGQREGATLFMVVLAGLDALLHRYTGQDDLVVGTPVGGRDALETEGLIGLFVNSLALRARGVAGATFR